MKHRLIHILLLALTALPLGACGSEEATSRSQEADGQRVQVTVDGHGYEPAEVRATAGRPLTLVFTRTTDEGCGQELVIASHNIRRDLPLNEPVEVPFTPTEPGRLRFTCGMDMYDGAILVE